MPHTTLIPATAQPVANYKMATRCESGHLLFLPTIAPVNPEGVVISPGEIRGQTRVIFRRLSQLLTESNGSFDSLVKLTTWLTSMEDFPVSKEVRDEYISSQAPPATLLEVPVLFYTDQLIQVEAIALID